MSGFRPDWNSDRLKDVADIKENSGDVRAERA